MTIYEEFGTFENLKICIAGDITHSRVAKSNMQILKRLGAQLYFAGPAEWYSNEFDVYGQHVAIDDVIENLDVLMLFSTNVMGTIKDFQKKTTMLSMV